jgi:hypothetical protein
VSLEFSNVEGGELMELSRVSRTSLGKQCTTSPQCGSEVGCGSKALDASGNEEKLCGGGGASCARLYLPDSSLCISGTSTTVDSVAYGAPY